MEVIVIIILFVKSIHCSLGLLVVLCGAVGHSISHKAELAQQDLPEEQIDPWVKDLIEGGQADCCQKEVAV